jgi:hypothetical protein
MTQSHLEDEPLNKTGPVFRAQLTQAGMALNSPNENSFADGPQHSPVSPADTRTTNDPNLSQAFLP